MGPVRVDLELAIEIRQLTDLMAIVVTNGIHLARNRLESNNSSSDWQ